MRKLGTLALALALGFSTSIVFPCLAQNSNEARNINKWFDDLDKKYPNLRKKYETAPLKTPSKLQTPGDIQVPTGLKAIKTTNLPCSQRFLIGADTLFEFDKATLNPRAEETLKVLAPMIRELGPHPVRIEGHTDCIGTDEYNQQLSERRAERVKNWLLENRTVSREAVEILGFGEKKPVAPNTKPDKSDNPPGRALNRRVEIIVNTCKTVEEALKEKAYAQKQKEAAAAVQPSPEAQTTVQPESSAGEPQSPPATQTSPPDKEAQGTDK